MKDRYFEWFKKYEKHTSTFVSKELSKSLSAVSFPQDLWGISNKQEYKQIKVIDDKDLLILTSMAGHAIKIFSLDDLGPERKQPQTGVSPIFEKRYRHQVVEVATSPKSRYAFFSLTDFGKENLRDMIVCLDLDSFETVFKVETKGKWSKVIAYHPDELLVVSNWHSNDLSVIDIKNIDNPRVTQLLPCGISPRGISFSHDGLMGIVAGFYSRNLTFLEYNNKDRKFYVDKITEPFDYPNYSGNMRHVVLDNTRNQAFVSNMGRNLIHRVDIESKKITESYPVASSPNTIILSNDNKYLAVSCRESNMVCVLDSRNGIVKALVDTGPKPTGLDFKNTNEDGIYDLYVTNFADDSIFCKRIKLV